MNKLILALTLIASPSFAAKTYQVTGPVLDVNANTITVQKGKDSWEMARDVTTKGADHVKKGDKVTVYYAMVAQDVEAKEAKKEKKK